MPAELRRYTSTIFTNDKALWVKHRSTRNMANMIIRAAAITDTERIAVTHTASIEALCSDCYAARDIAGWVEILSPNIYEHVINEKVMLVAEEDSEIVGLGILDLERSEISAVYVHPKIKGMGVGKRLLLELEAKALENNIDQLALCSTINALEFYKHCGYRGEDKTFHELSNGVKLECIRMHKTLDKQNPRRVTAPVIPNPGHY